MIEQIQLELSKNADEVNKINFGRVVCEIRHGKVYLIVIQHDYVPEKLTKPIRDI